MNDFLARNSNFQPSRLAERAGRAVLETQASGSTPDRNHGGRSDAIPMDVDFEKQLSTASEVAEAQAKVAALLSELGVVNDVMLDLDALEGQIAALLPRPTVIVPLPPADRDAVERAIEIAESIRASAMLAMSAQANVEPALAEGVLA